MLKNGLESNIKKKAMSEYSNTALRFTRKIVRWRWNLGIFEI